MRLHEAAPKLIIQERTGDKMKVSSYWPVPELTRAELALGRLQSLSLAQKTLFLFWLIQANLYALLHLLLVFMPLLYPDFALDSILSSKRRLVVIYPNFSILISPILHILLSSERQKMQSKTPKCFTILLSSLYYLVPFNFTLKGQV